jgi:hypothetical protein
MKIWPADSTFSSYWNTATDSDPGGRIAIVSTPRTGNTWLRRMLDSVYSLPSIVEDDPQDIDWQQLPERCVLQHHWDADPELRAKLEAHRFRIITISRHPLDTLISILHFASVHRGTATWFGRRGGSEAGIVNSMPRSRAFLDYASSDRAKMLLSISPSWAPVPDCLTVRYESFVQDTAQQLSALCTALRPAPVQAIQHAVQTNTMEKQRSLVVNQHCWQGQPNLWKRLLTSREAHQLADFHKPFFETFGYVCDPDPGLTDQEADANWYALELASLKEECRLARSQTLKVQGDASTFASNIAELQSQVKELRATLSELRTELEGSLGYRLTPSRLAGRARHSVGRFLKRTQKP